MSKPPSNHPQSRDNPGRLQISVNDVDKTSTPSTSPPVPSLAQSSSNSSSSPPEPSTPPTNQTTRISRSRTRPRYPNDLGRVPLHRRGTSKTYEALEDLLKEAGYKETRIFTPETERSADVEGGSGAKAGDDSRLSVVKDGMEAVVGFFAGLLPTAASSKTSLVSSSSTLEPSNGTGSGNGSGNGTTSESATAQPEPLTASPQDYSPPASPSPLSGSGVQRYSTRNPYASSISGSRQGQAGRRSFDMTEPPTPTTTTSSNLTSSVDSLNRLGAGDPTPKAVRSSRPSSASATANTFHSHTHPPYHHHHHHPPTTAGKSPIPRTPSHLSVDHPSLHGMQRPSSRSSMNRPGSSQGQYRGQSQAQAQGPSGSTNGMPHLPQSSHSSVRPNHHTPLTQSNLGQHQHHQAHPQHLHPHHQHSHPHPPHHPHSQQQIASPRPSRASAYLRHVASIPTIPAPTSRPNSTPINFFSSKFSSLTRRSGRQLNVSLNDKQGDSEDEDGPPSVYYRSGTGEEEERGPPMPPSWLETVARAVLFGGGSVGGPVLPPAHTSASASAGGTATTRATHTHHARVQALRPTRSSLSQVSSHASQYSKRSARSQLSDSTNLTGTSSAFLAPPPPHVPLHPPALFSRIERGRAGRSEGEVFKTRVICRSAPGSRSGSVVRGHGSSLVRGGGGGTDDDKRVLNLNLTSSGGKQKRKRKDAKGGGEQVPSLARTKAEGDVLWSSESKNRRKARKAKSRRMRSEHNTQEANGFSNGWNAESDSHTDDDDDDYSGASEGEYDDDEEEEEGELDLARILVPPKRQNSIRSLRKHLVGGGPRPARPASRGAGARSGSDVVPPVPAPPPTVSKGTNSEGGNAGSTAGGRLTPNTPYRKPFRTTSLQSSEWDDGQDHERDFEGWGRGPGKGNPRGSEDDDEHERHRTSFVGFRAS